MRKATVEFVPYIGIKEIYGNFFEMIEYMELLQMLRVDFDRGIKIGIGRYRLKEGCALEDLHLPMGSEILEVLNVNGNDYICLVRGAV